MKFHNTKNGPFIYVPSTHKIFSSHDVVFEGIFSSLLAYTPQPYSEALATRLDLSCIPYGTYSNEKTGDIITLHSFKKGFYCKMNVIWKNFYQFWLQLTSHLQMMIPTMDI